MDKVEYEEWALKAIDPALAPKPWSSLTAKHSEASGSEPAPKKDKVTIVYPKSVLEPNAIIQTLKAQLAHREPHHRAMMRRCIL